MTKPRLRLVAPPIENRTVTPRRPKNGDIRTRGHLTIDEVERLIEAAKNNRYGHRDALMVLLAFRHASSRLALILSSCGARTRAGRPCRQAAVTERGRCRMHGGAKGSGGPRGERNGNYRHGRWTREGVEMRRKLRADVREIKAFIRANTGRADR
jgi:hypothetical protein